LRRRATDWHLLLSSKKWRTAGIALNDQKGGRMFGLAWPQRQSWNIATRLAKTFCICSLLNHLGGCSPYVFSDEIGTIAQGTTDLDVSVHNDYAQYKLALVAHDRTIRILEKSHIVLSSGCSNISDTPCAIVVPGSGPVSNRTLAEENAAYSESGALKRYATALKAITNASDRTALDAATSKVAASFAGVTGAVPVAAPVGLVGSAVINLVGWIIGTALDNERFHALSWAVNTQQKNVATIATGLGDHMDDVIRAHDSLLFGDANKAAERVGPASRNYVAAYDGVGTSVADINSLKANPRKTAQALIDAHDKLVDAVNDPNRQLQSLEQDVAKFAELASALRDASSKSSNSPSKPAS
jgi:hypothetical protein